MRGCVSVCVSASVFPTFTVGRKGLRRKYGEVGFRSDVLPEPRERSLQPYLTGNHLERGWTRPSVLQV